MPYVDHNVQRGYQNAWIKQRRERWLAEHGPCVSCGSWDELEVDHRDPERKLTHRVWSWSESRRLAELAKCQVLCRSCHRAKTSAEQSRPIVHGRACTYDKRRCRCAPCRAAKSAYMAARRRARAGGGQAG